MTPPLADHSPFEARRALSSIFLQPRDPACWSRDVAAIRGRRDRESFLRIYDHFMPRLVRYLQGVGCTLTTAQDLAQETLLRLWQKADYFDPSRSHLSTWLFRIARNLRIDRLRSESHWLYMQEDIDGLDADGGEISPEASAEHLELQRAIERLPAVQARLIRMAYFEAKTHQEIADELHMPLGTVKSHLRRAFLKLQARITES
jgi:RNA polymerase sigma factor (sigma-70 family)